MRTFNLIMASILEMVACYFLLTSLNCKTDHELQIQFLSIVLLMVTGILFFSFAMFEGMKQERDKYRNMMLRSNTVFNGVLKNIAK